MSLALQLLRSKYSSPAPMYIGSDSPLVQDISGVIGSVSLIFLLITLELVTHTSDSRASLGVMPRQEAVLVFSRDARGGCQLSHLLHIVWGKG